MPTKKKPVTLSDYFEDIEDPRARGRNLRHPLVNILVTTVIGIACGQKTFTAISDFVDGQLDWFATFLDMSEGVPSSDTYRRVFEAINPETFEKSFSAWARGLAGADFGGTVAIDGKTIRNSGARGETPMHLVSAWASSSGIVLGQCATDQKSNEITAIPELLESLLLKGCIVTIDAMGCQKAIAEKIRERGADYVLAVKGNQPKLHEAVVGRLESHCSGVSVDPSIACHVETEKSHGRTTRRSCWVASLDEKSAVPADWVDLKSVIRVDSMVARGEDVSCESRYFVSSLDGIGAKQALDAVRAHWQIENKLHWCLDVTFGEDKANLRLRTLAENVSIARRVAMNIIRHIPAFTGNMAQTGRYAAFNLAVRDQLVKSMG